MEQNMKRALVFGGTGAVGRRVVRRLRDADVAVTFAYVSSDELAGELAEETGAKAVQLDLANADAIESVVASELEQGVNIFVNCAATAFDKSYRELDVDQLDEMWAVNVRAPMVAMRLIGPHMMEKGAGDVVLLGALDRQQSLPIPSGFATTQGALGAYAMSVAKECAGKVRVNLVAVGLLEEGLSEKLDPALVEDYQNFSALRRLGQPDEVARTVTWLALNNTYLNGEVVSVNGGI
jgi:NAD(P)-dependent dehydrogenase (short-subunit alcohol dehydrogenase family)